MNTSAQYVELKIQKGIRRAEENLVKWIQDALDHCEYGKAGKSKLEEAQFRNLVRVSDTTDSPEVIKNFLRYQVGREDKWGRGKGSLAERIVQNIDIELKQKAEEIAKGAQSENSEDEPANQAFQAQDVHIELIRRYLGYGARYLKYLNSLREKK